ncbi:MAG: hypothetical protein EXS18_02010 [Verrucomicrobiae bacterium]|nr:hypothetical protein [Verrucomicrobiae bacterium]
MKFPIYELRGDRRTRFPVIGFSDSRFDAHSYFVGRSEARQWRPRKVILTSGKSYPLRDQVGGSLGAPFVSERFRRVMESVCGKHAEFLPVLGPKKKQFFVFNVITIIDCLDLKRSQLGFLPKFVFDNTKVCPVPVFKVPHDHTVIFVTEPFIAAAREHHLTGIDFEYPHLMRIVLTETVVPGFPT